MKPFICACVLAMVGCTATIEPGPAEQAGETTGLRPAGEQPTNPSGPPAVGTPAPQTCANGRRDVLPGQRIWMLTAEQIPATLATIYADGPTGGPKLEVVTDTNRTFLGNDADLLKINTEQARSLVNGTEAVAAFVADRIDQFARCPADTPACFESFMRDVVTRAWRTPPTDAQVTRLRAVYAVGVEVSVREGYKQALSAVLKSPRFLYRTELGERDASGVFRLTPWEAAAQLSYFLLDAPPDAELRRLAASGTITRPEVFAQEANRLLRDPRARGLAARFLGRLTVAEEIRGVMKDKPGALGFGDDVTAALYDELRRFAEHLFFDADGAIADLFSRKETFANHVVASFYGAEVKAGTSFVKVPLPSKRTGILSMPVVMATHAQSDHVVPTTRGRFVFDKLLCTPVADPPKFPTELPAASPELTPRQRLAVMKDYPACAACHNRLDPVGFAFDNFDHVGRFVTSVKGAPVDPSGRIEGSQSTDGAFADLEGLAKLLAGSQEVRRCVHRQFLEFAQGRALDDRESCAIEASFQQLEASGGKLLALIRAALDYQHLNVRGISR